MKYLVVIATIVFLTFWGFEFLKADTGEDKGHAHEKTSDEEHKDDGGHHEEHEDHEHGEDEEESGGSVGPEKGITEASEEHGIKLSNEAIKSFDLKTISLSGPGPWAVPDSAKMDALEERNIYRFRNGFYKRIDFTILNQTDGQMTIKSKDILAGDEIVTAGVGFLRISELAAFGGAPEGHSH